MKSIFKLFTVVLILVLIFVACKTEDDSVADYIGTWFGSSVEAPGPEYFDIKSTFRADGTLEYLMYDVGGSTLLDNSMRGTYTSANNIFYVTSTEVYDGFIWTPDVQIYERLYSVSGNTMTLYLDLDDPPDGITETIWTLTRQ